MRHPAGLFWQPNSKGQSVKSRIAFLAVVLGTALLALVLADGGWPGI